MFYGIIKSVGEILGINTTGELLDSVFDYVFKRLFTVQEEQSKIVVIDFLDGILSGKSENIVDLMVINHETI